MVRLALIYGAVFVATTGAIFALVIWLATGFATHQLDLDVRAELEELGQAAPGAGLATAVAEYARRNRAIFYRLQDASGSLIAGDASPVLPAHPGVQTLPPIWQGSHKRAAPLRGWGAVEPDGSFLFVGESLGELRELQAALGWTLLLGVALTAAVALGAGYVTAARLLRRISTISEASRAIMAGDLARRIERHGGDEFDRLAGQLNAMLDRIGELMTDMQQVTNDIAHDLRTPLTRLRQRLELARHGARTPAQFQAAIDAAVEQCDAILRSFAAMLQIAQIEGGGRRAGFRPVALDEILVEVAELYRPDVESKGQVLRLDCAPIIVLGDLELLTQLFANLLVNALVHCPPGTRILLSTSRQHDRSVATVADDGPGIPDDQRAVALRRLGRLEASRSTPGTGLGLSIAAAVAKLHRADFVLSDGRPGLICRVSFPAGTSTSDEAV